MAESNALLSAALKYCAWGWSVIPLTWPSNMGRPDLIMNEGRGNAGKTPLIPWATCQVVAAGDADIRRWWGRWPMANVGVVMGRVSRLVAWDVDDWAGMQTLRDLVGEDQPPTWMFATGGGGLRILYRWPRDAELPPRHFQTGGKRLTFLGEGSYTVMPPSNHKSGKEYRWTRGASAEWCDLADAPPALIKALANVTEAQRKPVGGRGADPALTAVAADALQMMRARAWADKFEPAMAGEGGRWVAFKLACSLIHGFRLSIDEALTVMMAHWNPRCKPEWEEWELKGHVEGAAKRGTWDLMDHKGRKEVG